MERRPSPALHEIKKGSTFNREKGTLHARTARARNGQTRAPISKIKREEKREENTWGLASIGAISGAALAGPVGFVIGGLAGAIIGNEIDPD